MTNQNATPANPPPAAKRAKSRALGLGGAAIFAAVSLGLISGLGAFTFGYGKGFSYFSSNPQGCANCHAMQDHFDSWQSSSHHAVAVCNDCHLPHDFVGKWYVKADNGFFHSLAFTLNDYHEPIQIKARNRRVTQQACLHCHQDIGEQVYSTHQSVESLQCVQCHSAVGHSGRRRSAIGDAFREPRNPDE